MENNENNFQNDVEQANSKDKKITVALLVIVLVLVLAIGVGVGFLFTGGKGKKDNKTENNVNQTENIINNTVEVSEREMYESIIDEYKRVAKGIDINNFNYDDIKTIVNVEEIVTIYRFPENNSKLGYTFYDVDKNGTKEMITGLYDKERNIFIPSSVYGYNTAEKKADKIFHLDTLERGNLNIYDNGIIHSAGSGGAAIHIAEFGRIGTNGYSYEQLEWVEEELNEDGTSAKYTDLNTKKLLDYKNWDEMTEKYLKNANKVSFENIEVIEIENKSDSNEQKDKSNTSAEIIKKEIIASGWAGSSMHRVRLYSNGEAYYITFNGNGETDDCIIGKDLVARNAEDIITKNGEHGEFAGVIVKGKNMTVVNRNATDWIFFETANGDTNTNTATTNANSKYDNAIAAMKKCLKDESWLKANVYITADQQIIEGDLSDQTVNFIICRGDKLPIVIIEVASDNARTEKLVLVAYVNGSVKAEIISQGHIYHGGYAVDANNNVVDVEFMHMGDNSTSLRKITNGTIKFLGEYGYTEENNNGQVSFRYYIVDEAMHNQSTHKDVSEAEYNTFKANLNASKYKFVNVGTELNNQNVDEFVK